MRFFGKIVCGVVAAALGGAAEAATIDFGGATTDRFLLEQPYVEDGYTFTAVYAPGTFPNYELRSQTLFTSALGIPAALDITGLGLFSFGSLIYSSSFTNPRSTVTFTGYSGQTELFNEVITLPGGDGAINGLMSGSILVDRLRVTTLNTFLTSFDNFVLNDATAVPEPATWAMMIVGFGMAGAAMRRRKVAVA